MEPAGAILETVLHARDLDAAEAFYTRVFGLTVASRLAGKFVFLRCGAGMLLIFDRDQSALRNPKNAIPRHGAGGRVMSAFPPGRPGSTAGARISCVSASPSRRSMPGRGARGRSTCAIRPAIPSRWENRECGAPDRPDRGEGMDRPAALRYAAAMIARNRTTAFPRRRRDRA